MAEGAGVTKGPSLHGDDEVESDEPAERDDGEEASDEDGECEWAWLWLLPLANELDGGEVDSCES